MAITITNANANISDTTLSYAIGYTGQTGSYVIASILVNGVTIKAVSGTSPITVTYTAASLYNAAAGSTRIGAVTFRVEDVNSSDIVISTSNRIGGTITINYRMGGLTLTKPLSSSRWNMDLTIGNTLNASWGRTNTAAFYARLKGYVYNGSGWTQVFNRYGFGSSTGMDLDAYGYHDSIVAAMNGVTPRDFMLQVITQFNDGTADYEDLSYTASEGTNQRTTSGGSIIKTFFTPSTLTTSSFTLTPTLAIVPYTLTHHSICAHSIKLYVNNTLIRTEAYTPAAAEGTYSGNFAITATERTAILNAMPSNMTATSYAEVTENGATTDSKAYATSATISSTDYKPAIGTISWAESVATAYVKTVFGYTQQADAVFLTAKSKVTFTVPTTMATGASLVSIRVQFAGTDQTAALSPVTTSFLAIASLTSSYTTTVTDSRGQTITTTNGSIKVKAYTYPTVDKFEVYRANTGSTTYAPLGTYLRAIYKATASSITNATGVERNWIRVRIDSKVSTAADSTYLNKLETAGTTLTIPETISAEYSGYLTTTVYSVRIRVYDAFYDLDNDASILEDTDDYSQNVQTLPYGKVSMMLGDEYMSVGKVWTQGTLDVAGDVYANGIKLATLAAVYPVGSIYMSVLATNPSTIFGGTWVALPDRFLVGVGTTFGAGSAAGAMSHVHSTTDHVHTLNAGFAMFNMYTGYNYMRRIATPQYYDTHKTSGTYSTSNTTNSFGIQLGGSTDGADRALSTSDVSHLPPYLAVYMWKRTA